VEKARGRRTAHRGSFRPDLRTIEPEREGVRRHYGITYSDGTIRIRCAMRRRAAPEVLQPREHRLPRARALKHFNHGPRFKRYYFKLLDWARAEGIYRPATAEPAPPIQLGLFMPRRPRSTRE
jgi:hypothetical protein